MWRFLGRLVERAGREFFDDGCPHLAASISFRVLFSLFPLAIVLGALFSAVAGVAGVQADVNDALARNLPLDDDGEEQLRSLLEEAQRSTAIGWFGAIGLVWAASGMMSAVRTALNLAWEVEDRRPWLLGKLVDVALVFASSLVVALSVALNLTVRLARELVEDLGIAAGVADGLIGLAAPFALVFVVVLALYRVVPATNAELRDIAGPAALVAAVVTVAQVLFAVYVENFGRYNAIYGTLGAVIAFMFFVYLASLVFLFGAELASATPRVRAEPEPEQGDDGASKLERLREAAKGLVVRTSRSDS